MCSSDLRGEGRGDGKAQTLYLDAVAPGVDLAAGAQKALDAALAQLPIPKVMTYQLQDGWSSVRFVRPAHGLVALHGDQVVPLTALGLHADRHTQGHRFEAAAPILTLAHADHYEQFLRDQGAVVAQFETRREEIRRQLQQAAEQQGLTPVEDPALLDRKSTRLNSSH